MPSPKLAIFCALLFAGSALQENTEDGVETYELSDELNIPLSKLESLRKEEPLNLTSRYCRCNGDTCSCCAHVHVADLSVNGTLCSQVDYLPKDYGVDLEFTWNGEVVLRKEVSAKNPPKICVSLPIPHMEKLLDLCIKLHDLSISSHYFQTCLRVSADMLYEELFGFELGCVHFGHNTTRTVSDWFCAYPGNETDASVKPQCISSCQKSTVVLEGAKLTLKSQPLQNDRPMFKSHCHYVMGTNGTTCNAGCYPADFNKLT